jgi:signal transduction histidine kinase
VELSGSDPQVPDATLTLPVHHRGELLGALAVARPRGERLTPTEEKLARDLAAQAGLVLRNVRLTEELLERLDDLRASRARIIAAADAERRRLERDLHDGSQQQLLGLAVKLRLARALLEKDPARADALVSDVEADAAEALQTLRDLARGIYPPLLADAGLAVALGAQFRKVTLPIEFDPDGIGRYAAQVEAAVYFCCLEALQNVSKYASASRLTVRLSEGDGVLSFEVTDDGRGFDPHAGGRGTGLQGMADRLAALGGVLQVTSAPGSGTTVAGRLPVPTMELVG